MRLGQPSANRFVFQRGISLVEIMVCALLLTIGLLGAVSGHVGGLRSTQNSYFHSQAEFLAKDMAERIRANRDAALTGLYSGFDTQTVVSADLPSCGSTAGGCTASEQVLVDQMEWVRNFAGVVIGGVEQPLLPSGRGVIASAGNQFSITVSWLAAELQSAPAEIVVEFTL